MFYDTQTKDLQYEYEKKLQLIGSLSNLFSDSATPYLYYRVAEKVFCNVFTANDLSRGDIALDAYKGRIGIGLKTFLANNYKTFQKVAEFNKDKSLYDTKEPLELIQTVANLRNKRIEFTQNLYALEKSCYHCVLRDKEIFKIYEERMYSIDLVNIRDVVKKNNSIIFNDGLHEYSFNLSKSTLFKRFETKTFLCEFPVKIMKNPLEEIAECFSSHATEDDIRYKIVDTLYLPLYGSNKDVKAKSGLNQWNAHGRQRDVNEVYIPIPIAIHKCKKDFFPPRNKHFTLRLPNGTVLQAKVCQANAKALMSDPNKALGKWILRDVLTLKEGELLTYKKLAEIGVDSVRIDKFLDGSYEINFAQIDSYENFILGCV